MIVQEIYGREDSILRFQNGRLQATEVHVRNDTIERKTIVLPNGKRSFTRERFFKNGLLVQELTVRFDEDTLSITSFRYNDLGQLVHQMTTEGQKLFSRRYVRKQEGRDTSRVVVYEQGSMMREITMVAHTNDSLQLFKVFHQNTLIRETEWRGGVFREYLANPYGPVTTMFAFHIAKKERMRVVIDHENNTRFTLFTFFDKNTRVIGQMGFYGRDYTRIEPYWSIHYDTKGREKDFVRMDHGGRIVYREKKQYNSRGLLSRTTYLGKDSRPFVEERYKYEYRE